MSGEDEFYDTCADCGYPLDECECPSVKIRVSYLENKFEKLLEDQNFIKKVSLLNDIDSKINLLFEKLEDNAKRLNSMMLEMKGIISITRGNLNRGGN